MGDTVIPKKTNRGYKKGTEWHPWILLVPSGYLT